MDTKEGSQVMAHTERELDEGQVYDIASVITSLDHIIKNRVLENETKRLLKANRDVLVKVLEKGEES